MWKTGFANQRGETALQEENDQLGLNGVNCRNSLRVNCSTIELGTSRIWVAFGFFGRRPLDLGGRVHPCACGDGKLAILRSCGGGWQAEIVSGAILF